MQQPSAHRLALFERLAAAHAGALVVVTPGRRLARALAREFDAWQAARGQAVWETADILPFGAFVARLYDTALHDPALSGVRWPLSSAQERALWEAVIGAGPVALATPSAAAALAADAWALVHQWQVAEQFRNYALTDDTQAFAAWAAAYERRVDAHGALDAARLPDAVAALIAAGRVSPPALVLMAGFDELTPQQQSLFDTMTAQGGRCERLALTGASGTAARAPAADGCDELSRMADWVADRLARDPRSRIGIVVPDLAARRRAVERALDSALEPDRLLEPPDRTRPYTVSLGGSLAEVPLVATALRLLRLAVGELDFAEASALLRARHADFGPRTLRESFDAALRRRVGRRVALGELVGCARGSDTVRGTRLYGNLAALQSWHARQGSARRRCSEWAARFTEGLRSAGFPGTAPLDSSEYQAHARWCELMSEFAALDRVLPPLGLAEAVARLRRLAGGTTFQPEGGDPPVQVVGLLEANGLAFDHLWLLGMTIDAWPPPARPHPLLAVEMQRHRRMPGALAEAELARTRATLDRLLCAAPEIVASHAARDGDRVVAPSPLIRDWPVAAAQTAAPRALYAMPSATLESLLDAAAPAVPGDSPVAGGVATLDDQAACPFRAFALHRLRARPLDVPHDGFDAMERGTMLHEVMRRFWDRLPERTRTFLAALAEDEMTGRLADAADGAISEVRRRRGGAPGDAIATLERERLVALAREWLRYEIDERTDFTVVSHEEPRELIIGSLRLSGRLDRVDALPDGRTVIIDYKTGSRAGIRDWLEPRPDSTQLPLYLVATQPDASAIAIARVRRGEAAFISLGEERDLLPGTSTRWTDDHPAWPALVDAWRERLTLLAGEFAHGRADAAPKRADTCSRCAARVVCRVVERGIVPDGGDEE